MSRSFFYLIRFIGDDMIIQHGTVYKDISDIGGNTYIIFFSHAMITYANLAQIVNYMLDALMSSNINFECYTDHIRCSKVNADLAGIIIRYAVKAFLLATGKQRPIIPYLIYHKGQEYMSESAWESAHWHVSYAIYKNLIQPKISRKHCIII